MVRSHASAKPRLFWGGWVGTLSGITGGVGGGVGGGGGGGGYGRSSRIPVVEGGGPT